MKDLKISKELLGEVMKDKGTFETININKNELSTFGVLGHHIFSINIYEFGNKCKEWVNKQGYWANSGYDNKYYCMLRDMPDNQWFYADTEVEAIIKACEWILSEVNK